MGLLLDISHDVTRLEGLGLHPIVILMSDVTKAMMTDEMLRYALTVNDKRFLGMDIMANQHLDDGVFRILVGDK